MKSVFFFQRLSLFLYHLVVCFVSAIGSLSFALIFLFASFTVPSSSMEPTLYTGDYILVLKWWMGARIFNANHAIQHKAIQIYRLPGLERLRRNDIVVFNYPYPDRNDSIGFNLLKYYVKRCVGVPGDSIEIRKTYVYIRNKKSPSKYSLNQNKLQRTNRNLLSIDKSIPKSESFPNDTLIGWATNESDPLLIPYNGCHIALQHKEYILYKTIIEWESKCEFKEVDENVFALNGTIISSYTFQKNYYFMLGDNFSSSYDSRDWGLVPEEYIVGIVWGIWKSINKHTGKFRWNRFMKRVV